VIGEAFGGLRHVTGTPDRPPSRVGVSIGDTLAALHGTRLEMLMARTIDTTVRGVVYEAAGTVDAGVLAGGAETVGRLCDTSRIPYRLLRADPGDAAAWVGAASACVDAALGG